MYFKSGVLAWFALLAILFPLVASQDTWCGKVYLPDEPIVIPGGEFPDPATSTSPLLALRCNPVIRPYLSEDISPASQFGGGVILVDALVRYKQIAGASPVDLTDGDENVTLTVMASVEGQNVSLGTVTVGLNGTAELSFDLGALEPSFDPFNVTCTGTLSSSSANSSNQTFTSTTPLFYLPDPPSDVGSVTKMDFRTGALLAKPLNSGKDSLYQAVLPVGFYGSFDGYLDQNRSVLETLKEQGFNVLHPVPSFDNETALEDMLEWAEEIGLYLIYDMRNDYQNLTSVSAQVSSIKSRSNLLIYYTADEPDGWQYPLNSTLLARQTINSPTLGDPYRPTSLVLNCFDYYFTPYTSGADIVLQDTYPIGINATFSYRGTPCTPDLGDCGCDDCRGVFEDVRVRNEVFLERLEALGWERQTRVWGVPQGFGSQTYWDRTPTGAEWLVLSIVNINSGALGLTSWEDPTTDDIKTSASSLALALPSLTPFILPLYPSRSTYTHVVTDDRLDFGLWSLTNADGTSGGTLVLASNLNYANVSTSVADILGGNVTGTDDGWDVQVVLDGQGASIQGGEFVFGSVGSGAWIFDAGSSG